MDTATSVIISILATGFFTHLITNFFGDRKLDKVLKKVEGLADSINLLTVGLKEYVRQDIHREDIKDLYEAIKELREQAEACRACVNYKKAGG